MSHKHYIAIAQILKNARAYSPVSHKETVDMITSELCSILKTDNPRFDIDRFKEATK